MNHKSALARHKQAAVAKVPEPHTDCHMLRMIHSMTTKERVTVTLPADLLATAKAASGGNLSAYVERAVRAQALSEAGEAITAWRGGAAADLDELADVFGEDVA
ncbi:type II toxin-antitoxin system CcdA family antitoxin [Streptomyces lunaelactis]|uniref:type II toxin-antitoxin system CcdA family antitoxin n=1 Tax=Streptomyces lunaelactis TaxID=1535768 RepID=UPI0028153049|nr:type II toxin-antitoxin system CcdA family antitoxin [Streptomyces lunaelactis]